LHDSLPRKVEEDREIVEGSIFEKRLIWLDTTGVDVEMMDNPPPTVYTGASGYGGPSRE
jgi:hypothetical protein